MVIKNWQNQQNSFIFHMTPIAYEEKHCKIAQYCVYVLLSYFVFREKLREGRTKLPGSEAMVLCTVDTGQYFQNDRPKAWLFKAYL